MIGLYSRQDPPRSLAPYVQAFHLADAPDLELDVTSPATGYPLLGLIWRGFAGADIDGRSIEFRTRASRHFSGQNYRKRAVVHWRGGIGHAVAELRAAGFYELFGLSGELLVNTTREVRDVHTDFDTLLATTTKNCSGRDDYLAAMQEALTQQVKHACQAPAYVHQAIEIIENAHGAIRLSDVIAACDVGERTFHATFKSVVGLNPKYFCRVVQFNHVGRLILSGAVSQLADLAADAGFYDQAHFTRAFREFAANSPQAFLASDEVHLSSFIRLINKN